MCREEGKSGVAAWRHGGSGQHVELLATVSHARTPACNFSSIRVVILKVRRMSWYDINVIDINVIDINVIDINVIDINVIDINVIDVNVIVINVIDINAIDINVIDINDVIDIFPINVIDIFPSFLGGETPI